MFDLERDCEPQVYGIGIKELWDIDPAKHVAGPRDPHAGLAARRRTGAAASSITRPTTRSRSASSSRSTTRTPGCRPFEEFQRWKQHPAIRAMLEGGRRVSYGARAINEGGWQSVPQLVFPGGALIGCSAGFVNVPRIKGSHTAMKSGMLAAEAAYRRDRRRSQRATSWRPIRTALDASWIAKELKLVRNAEPAVAKFGGTVGTMRGGRRHVDAHAAASGCPSRCGTSIADNETTWRANLQQADRLSQARRRDQLRPAVVGVHLGHQPRGGPAGPPDAQGSRRCRSTVNLTLYDEPRAALLPGRRLRDRRARGAASRGCRSTRRTASTARPATSRTRPRTSTGSCPRAAAGRTIRICEVAAGGVAAVRHGPACQRRDDAGRSAPGAPPFIRACTR